MILRITIAIAFALLAAVQPVQADLSAARYNTVYFDFDRDTLESEAKNRIRRQAAYINSRTNVRFAVTGHTDKVGNEAYNMALGLRRANRVLNELVRLGVDRNRLVAMVSMGEEDPAVDVETRERRNRRVTTRVLLRKSQSVGPGTSVLPAGNTPVVTSGVTPGGTEPSTDVVSDTTEPEPEATTWGSTRPGNSAEGTGRPDAGGGNGNEPSGDPAGSVGHNKGGDETGS